MAEKSVITPPGAKRPERDKYMQRWSMLKNERSSWVPHWKDISIHLLPRSGRFFLEDRDKGQKRNNNIYDSTGTKALNTLAAGLMSGMTSPARPWFRLGVSDPDLASVHEV
ncbi:MAG: phage head-tail adapter protein, partial [Patescibacteria group bacterium]|nr:phage head-tail adapter protein [Patescibacteria group bacterium]